ncbi:hypothetical protein K435DRAFT_868960 [Dendrothele bispora CBS 962.96]|uniref:Uncharacterized protein n=1 Tax=Dendrothele bispora (strain CBS 962.96) TaxID=1314807 RepID=A0A4S8LAD2_DENBC|nr:hypothetical protein K435DRAFT_868960 [Dendrothele bispora CBS 962.96]
MHAFNAFSNLYLIHLGFFELQGIEQSPRIGRTGKHTHERHKHESLALSPSKAVQKRKPVFLSDAQSAAKRPKLT